MLVRHNYVEDSIPEHTLSLVRLSRLHYPNNIPTWAIDVPQAILYGSNLSCGASGVKCKLKEETLSLFAIDFFFF
jgi:hypothetical protein